MMNPLMIVSLFLLSLSAHSAGENSNIQANGAQPPQAKFEAKYGAIQGNEQADRLLKIPQVKAIYEKCVADDKPVETCLWDGVRADDSTKKLVQDELDKMNNSRDGIQDKDKAQYEERNLSNIRINSVANDPSKRLAASDDSPQKKLEAYLFKKFTEAMYGKDKNDKKLMMDHNVFYSLYQSQLGKNLISAISSYAMDSENVSGVCLVGIGVDLPNIRKTNLEMLSQQTQVTGKNPDGTDKTPEDSSAAYGHWGRCSSQIEALCTGSAAYNNLPNPNNDDPHPMKARIDESKKRSCAVYRYIKDTRQALKEMELLSKKMEEKAQAGFNNNPTEQKLYQREKIDEMMAVSSQEMVQDSGMQDALNKRQEELKKCETEYDANKEVCDKYLSGTKEDTDKLKAEYALRTSIQNEKMEKDFDDSNKDSDKNLIKYLQEEGRTQEQIDKIMAQTLGKLAELKREIKAKFKNERQELINGLSDKLRKTSIEKKPEDTQGRLADIKKEFDARPDYLKQLVFFNNIVTGFIEVGGSGGKSFKNTAALEHELKKSAFATENRTPASGTNAPASSLSNINVSIDDISKIKPKEGNSNGESVNLDVNQINDNFIKVEVKP